MSKQTKLDGKKSLKKILKIKDNGYQTYADKQFLKTVQYAKGSNTKWRKIMEEKSGKCERYVDESLIKEQNPMEQYVDKVSKLSNDDLVLEWGKVNDMTRFCVGSMIQGIAIRQGIIQREAKKRGINL